jgi:hypothetical protein
MLYNSILNTISDGCIGNFAYDALKYLFTVRNGDTKNKTDSQNEEKDINNAIVDTDIVKVFQRDDGENRYTFKRNYKTFDVVNDFKMYMQFINEPVVHIVVEGANLDSAWHLPVIVIEEPKTGQWFVFSKGRVALEGCGGGLHNFEDMITICVDKNAGIAAWVLNYYDSEKLSQGCALWPIVKPKCIPLLSYKGSTVFDYIKSKYTETKASSFL